MPRTKAPTLPGYRTAEQAAKKFGYEYSYFTRLCREGRVKGAVKVAGVWWIPDATREHHVRVPMGRPHKD